MTTARATTNGIGNIVSSIDGIGGINCKTDCFKIHVEEGSHAAFLDAGAYSLSDTTLLGDILNHSNDAIQTIGQHLFENGMVLTKEVDVFLLKVNRRNNWEIRVDGKRYICLVGRIYARAV